MLDRIAERLGADRCLADVAGDELGAILDGLWRDASPAATAPRCRRGWPGVLATAIRRRRFRPGWS
ncbi:MAG: hypothetical protein M3O70_12600, partial [Actinomycetota bacterium]|nr:hypothetical protein [Actinomycetota bacterium]